jgi:hypothetical protein
MERSSRGYPLSLTMGEALMKCATYAHVEYCELFDLQKPLVRGCGEQFPNASLCDNSTPLPSNYSMDFLHAFAANASMPFVSITPLMSS